MDEFDFSGVWDIWNIFLLKYYRLDKQLLSQLATSEGKKYNVKLKTLLFSLVRGKFGMSEDSLTIN